MNDIASFPTQASTARHSVDLLLVFLLWCVGVWACWWRCLLIFFSVQYRRRPGQVDPPPETHQSRCWNGFGR